MPSRVRWPRGRREANNLASPLRSRRPKRNKGQQQPRYPCPNSPAPASLAVRENLPASCQRAQKKPTPFASFSYGLGMPFGMGSGLPQGVLEAAQKSMDGLSAQMEALGTSSA